MENYYKKPIRVEYYPKTDEDMHSIETIKEEIISLTLQDEKAIDDLFVKDAETLEDSGDCIEIEIEDTLAEE